MHESIEMLPSREALLFDIGRFTGVAVGQNVQQGNIGLAGIAALFGFQQGGNALGLQNVVVNQL